jgi:CheY-like chemotaxis protein
MKYALVCPRCGGKRIYAIKQASMPCCHDARQTRALTIAATGWNVLQPSMLSALLEARICDRCGLTELYTRNTDALAVMDELGLAQVRLLDGEHEAVSAPSGPPERAAAAARGCALDVLLVAGSEPAKALRQALEERAHRVVLAGSAETARQLGRDGARFDVAAIACDLDRERDGLALAEELLEAAVTRTVVTLLARSDIADAMRARDLGAFVRLGKPDTRERFLEAVERREADP